MRTRHLVNVFVIILLFVAQSTILNYIEIIGIKPDIMLAYAVSLAFMYGESEGIVYGFLCGFLADCAFPSSFGINMLLYTAVCLAAGFLFKSFYKENVIMSAAAVFVSTFLFNFFYWLLCIMPVGNADVGYYLYAVFLPSAVYGTIFALPIYAAAYRLNSYTDIYGRRLF